MKLVEAEAELSKFRDFIAKKTPSDAGKKMFEAIQTMLGEIKRLKVPPDERVAELEAEIKELTLRRDVTNTVIAVRWGIEGLDCVTEAIVSKKSALAAGKGGG